MCDSDTESTKSVKRTKSPLRRKDGKKVEQWSKAFNVSFGDSDYDYEGES